MRLTTTQYNSIMQIYQQLRQDRDTLIKQRRSVLRRSIPEFAALEDGFRNAGRHGHSRHTNYRQMAEQFVAAEKQILESHGYPSDYLDPPFRCSDCCDTGYVGENHDTPCHCFRKYATDLIYRDEPVMRRLLTDSFDSFSLSHYPSMRDRQTGDTAYDCARRALDHSQQFVKTFDDPDIFRNMFFYGPSGSGKTFLTSCIAGSLLRSDHSVIYISAVRLFSVMADYTFNEKKSTDTIAYDSLFSSELVIIDDLGTEVTNTFTVSAFFDLINTRLLREKPTIISTNLALDEVRDTYSERVYSRLIEKYNFYHLFGFDGRYENKLKDLTPAHHEGEKNATQ